MFLSVHLWQKKIIATNAHLLIHYEGCLSGKSGEANVDLNDADDSTNPREVVNVFATSETASNEKDFVAFPNPSSDGFTIASLKSVPISYLEVYDLSGNLRYVLKEINQMGIEIEPELDKGIYILKLYSYQKQWQTKFMKL